MNEISRYVKKAQTLDSKLNAAADKVCWCLCLTLNMLNCLKDNKSTSKMSWRWGFTSYTDSIHVLLFMVLMCLFPSGRGLQQWRGSVWLGHHNIPWPPGDSQHTQTIPQPLHAHSGFQWQIQVRWHFCLAYYMINPEVVVPYIKGLEFGHRCACRWPSTLWYYAIRRQK